MRLKYSIGKVLSVMPVNRVMDYLNVILTPSFEEIQKLVSTEPVSTLSAFTKRVFHTVFYTIQTLNIQIVYLYPNLQML